MICKYQLVQCTCSLPLTWMWQSVGSNTVSTTSAMWVATDSRPALPPPPPPKEEEEEDEEEEENEEEEDEEEEDLDSPPCPLFPPFPPASVDWRRSFPPRSD